MIVYCSCALQLWGAAEALRENIGAPLSVDDTVQIISIIRDITARKRAEAEREQLQEEIIRAQEATLIELSTPLIPVTETTMVMPLIGTIDSRRA